jgi:hypothetical protein
MEPSSQFQHLSDDYRRRLRSEVRQAVWAWMRAGDETNVNARFDFAVDVLLPAGAYFSAAVQEGDGCVEPAHLAASAYLAAQCVIDAPNLRNEARELFREVSNPRPAWEPPPEEREAVERFKELIVSSSNCSRDPKDKLTITAYPSPIFA